MFKSSSPYIKILSKGEINWNFTLSKELFHKAMEEDIIIYLHIGSYTDIPVRQKALSLFSNKNVINILNNNFIPIVEDKEDRPESYLIAIDLLLLNDDISNGPYHIFIMPNRQPIIAFSDSDPDVFMEIANSIIDANKNSREKLKLMADELSKRAINTGVITNSSKISSNYFLIDNKLQKWFKETINSKYLVKINPYIPNSSLLYSLLDYLNSYNKSEYVDKIELILEDLENSLIYDVVNGGFFRKTIYIGDKTPLYEKNIEEIALLVQVYILAYKIFNKQSYLDTINKSVEFLLSISNSNGFPISISLTDNESESMSYYTFSLNELQILFYDRYLYIAEALSLDVNIDSKYRQIPKRNENTYRMLTEEDILILKGREKEHIGYFIDPRIITSANFIVLKTLILYSKIYSNQELIDTVQRLYKTLLDSNLNKNSSIAYRYSLDGEQFFFGSLSDYAAFIDASMHLYLETNNNEYLNNAVSYTDYVIDNFYKQSNGMFSKSQNTKECDSIIPFKRESNIDIVRPSANSMMCGVLIDLYKITGDTNYFILAKKQLDNILPNISESGVMLSNWANQALKVLRIISE